MSKTSELDHLLTELIVTNERALEVAKAIRALFEDPGEQPEKIEVVGEPPMDLTKVRAVLAEKSRAGFTAEIRELLKKYGAERLSDIDPAKYKELLADAEVFGNAT